MLTLGGMSYHPRPQPKLEHNIIVFPRKVLKNMLDKKVLNNISQNFVSKENYMESFRENVHKVIDEKGVTLQSLADDADMQFDSLRNFIYKDSKDCNLSTAVKLAKAIGVSVDELVGCDTLTPETKESLRIVRTLPKSFTHFVRWAIRYHRDFLKQNKDCIRAIQIMTPEFNDKGNLKMTNDFDVKDISHIDVDIMYKIFMGIRIPCEFYMPYYSENDIIYIANDRKPRTNEKVVVTINHNMWILHHKIVAGKETYFSKRANVSFDESSNIVVLGYICYVERSEEY